MLKIQINDYVMYKKVVMYKKIILARRNYSFKKINSIESLVGLQVKISEKTTTDSEIMTIKKVTLINLKNYDSKIDNLYNYGHESVVDYVNKENIKKKYLEKNHRKSIILLDLE